VSAGTEMLKHQNRALLWPLAIVLMVFLASGRSELAAPDPGFTYDKLAHFIVFGLLATSILRVRPIIRYGWKGVLAAACLVSLYGALDELRQSFTPGRSVEVADWVADTLGALVACTVYLRWQRYRKLLEWPCKKAEKGKSEMLKDNG